MTRAVKTAARTQKSTVVASVLIMLAYLAGMYVNEYCAQLFDPVTKEDIFK